MCCLHCARKLQRNVRQLRSQLLDKHTLHTEPVSCSKLHRESKNNTLLLPVTSPDVYLFRNYFTSGLRSKCVVN